MIQPKPNYIINKSPLRGGAMDNEDNENDRWTYNRYQELPCGIRVEGNPWPEIGL